MEINARNVSDALSQGIDYLLHHGIRENSRNGMVIAAPGPVMTIYARPWERVLFSPTRDANPFFHLMESLWMLAGRHDLDFLTYFVKSFADFSDDGENVWGAYGWRWREFFGFDQLKVLIRHLQDEPNSRRAVLTMWAPIGDLISPEGGGMGGLCSKDVPCNTHVYFDRRGGVLNMTVCNRSNDIIWGAYGANAVHMSFLQEYVAAALGCAMGEYRQFSNNYHVYTDKFDIETLQKIADEAADEAADAYIGYDDLVCTLAYAPIVTGGESIMEFDADLVTFFDETTDAPRDYFKTYFFRNVVVPMRDAYRERKSKISDGLSKTKLIDADDWKLACTEWIERREAKKAGA